MNDKPKSYNTNIKIKNLPYHKRRDEGESLTRMKRGASIVKGIEPSMY